MTLGAGIREPNYDCIHWMSVGAVSEPVVTGTGILVDVEEQIRRLRDVDILLWRQRAELPRGSYLLGKRLPNR